MTEAETPMDVRYETHGAVALLTLDRPRFRNAQSWKLLDDLDAQLDRAVADPDVRVVVLRGAGDHFSSGHDLGTPEQLADVEGRGLVEWEGLDWYEAFRKYNLDLTVKWRNLPIPTVAMVHGYCIFGGWMIAAAMDVIYASRDARFLASLFETFTVPWDIPPRAAKELLFESRFLGAEEAHRLGLVNRVLEGREELERETLAYAARVAENSPAALRLSKLAVNKAQDTQGYSAFVEAAFADYLVLRDTRGANRVEGAHRLGGVELALRGERGERPGQDKESEGAG